MVHNQFKIIIIIIIVIIIIIGNNKKIGSIGRQNKIGREEQGKNKIKMHEAVIV